MKKFISLILAFVFFSCLATQYYAPVGKDVKLMTQTEPASVKTSKRVFYLLNGLIPLTDNSTSDVVSKYNLKKVRVKTYYGVIDYLITFLTGGLVASMTMEIEGEPSK